MNTVYGIHSVEETLKSRPKGVHYVAMARVTERGAAVPSRST